VAFFFAAFFVPAFFVVFAITLKSSYCVVICSPTLGTEDENRLDSRLPPS
jgi:hypothetical protein